MDGLNKAREKVVTEACIAAAAQLGLDDTMLSMLLEITVSDVSALNAETTLASGTKAHTNGIKLIQLYEALVALVGTDQQFIRGWLESENKRWGCPPIVKLSREGGIHEVVAYLQSANHH